jgi:hypothetical protein
MSLMLDPAKLARRQAAEEADYYQVGQAFGLLIKAADTPIATPVLHGRLVVSKSGWALLTVPNALVRGLFDAIDEKGVELPPGHEGGPFTAHISVMRGEEIDKIGGPAKITERGHPFSYQLGPMMSVEPKGWSDMSRVWFVKVISPELKALRKSYGLPPLPNGDHEFHISVAVRKKNVLSQGPTSKAAADESDEGDDEDVHSDYNEDVHPDDDNDADNDRKPKLPLVMRRIVYSETQLSYGKPADDDDGIRQFLDQIRERHGPTKAAGALAKLGQWSASEKQADASDIIAPTLIGAGLGGAGGYGIGQVFGSEDPWRDTMYGGGLGGIIGARAGLNRAASASPWSPPSPGSPLPSLPGSSPPAPSGAPPASSGLPPVSSRTKMRSLADVIAPYYKGLPGGFGGAVARAEQNQVPYAGSIGSVPWKAEDLQAKVPVTSLTPSEALVAKDRPKAAPDTELRGWATPRINQAAKDNGPVANVTVVDSPGTKFDADQIEEHELTHTGLQFEPLRRMVKDPRTSRADIPDAVAQTSGNALVRQLGGKGTMVPESFEDYATSVDELDPRLAMIKRLYVQNHNKDVTTDAEAKDAMKWFRNWITTPEGKAKAGSTGQDWESLFSLPEWPTLERAAARRMPGLVDTRQLGAGMKVAADDTIADILAGWKPPEETPFTGFEGFAPKFHVNTPSEQWADTLGRAALTAAPPAAVLGGLALWRPWEQPPPPPKSVRRRRPAVKAAAVSDVANAIYSQLPRIRLPDTIAGAGVGALGGLAYDALRGVKPGESRWRKRLGRALTGAGVGALGANVVGDRARRYISNTLVPFGYKPDSVEEQKTNIASRIWEAGIMDRPQYGIGHEKGLARLKQYGAPPSGYGPGPQDYDYRKDTLENYILPSRREIVRRQLGVHTDDPTKDIWVAGPNDQLSLNPQNPRAVATAQRFMGGLRGGIPSELFRGGSDASRYIDEFSKGVEHKDSMFETGVVGGQQIPYIKKPGGGIEGSILDRWDYTLDPKEDVFFRENARNMLDPAWRSQPFDPKEPLSGYMNKETFPTNESAWKALGGRWGLDNLVAYKHPWITQRFRVEPDPAPPPPTRDRFGFKESVPTHRIQLLTPEGSQLGDPITRASNQEFIKRPFAEKEGSVRNTPVMPESMKLAADYAPGLPAKENFGPFDRLRVGQMLDYIVQAHNADRAGPHHDIRFGDKDMGLLSWAARKGVPEPGAKHLAVQQPVHRHDYKDFEGEIPEGYGKGTVKKHTEGQVLITKVTPESVHFTTAHQRHPERFTLARPKGWGDRNWLLMNTTPNSSVGHDKLHYKSIPPEQVEPHLHKMQEGDTAEAKVDGASQLIELAKGHAEMLSYRTSKTTGRPIFHTERFFQGRPEIKVPRHLEGSTLKGEMYAHTSRPSANGSTPSAGEPGVVASSGLRGAAAAAPEGGRTTEVRAGTPQDVSTLLNSSVARSLQLQKERGLGLKTMLYDIQRYGKKDIDPNVTPRAERRKMLEEIVQHLPADKFHLSEEHKGPEAAAKLWDMIRSGQHRLTEEGLVVHPQVGTPSKAKIFGEHDVVLRETFPGKGRRSNTVGGFRYSHTPKGPIVGRVGTGLSDATLAHIASDPSAYIGRVARLKAQAKLPSTALRAPSFVGLHEDYPDQSRGQVRPVGGDRPRAKQAGDAKQLVDLPLCLRDGQGHQKLSVDRNSENPVMRLFAKGADTATASHSWDGHDAGVQRVAQHDHAMHLFATSPVQGLGRPGDHGVRPLAGVRGISGGYGSSAVGSDSRAEEQQRPIFAGQLSMGDQVRAREKQAGQPTSDGRRSDTPGDSLGGAQRDPIRHDQEATGEWLLGLGRGIAGVVPRQTVHLQRTDHVGLGLGQAGRNDTVNAAQAVGEGSAVRGSDPVTKLAELHEDKDVVS